MIYKMNKNKKKIKRWKIKVKKQKKIKKIARLWKKVKVNKTPKTIFNKLKAKKKK